jgi:AraC-like DNA-binding protein
MVRRIRVFVRTSTIETVPQADIWVSTYRSADLGPINIGEVVFQHELRLECDDVGTGFYVQLPIAGRFESRHRGVDMMVNRMSSAVYRPGGGSFFGRWPAGYRALCVRIDLPAVETTLARLMGDRASSRFTFDPIMNTGEGYGRAWAELLLSVNRQLVEPGGLLSQPLVAAPLADSIVNGFLLAASQSHLGALAAPIAAARPAAVRVAIDLVESAPQAPLTLSALAEHCGVGPRTLQKGFQQHLGMSPMEYVRDVRLRRAHEELRAADPFTVSVAAVARRWGFGHLGRFAAAHEAKYGQLPLRTLRG